MTDIEGWLFVCHSFMIFLLPCKVMITGIVRMQISALNNLISKCLDIVNFNAL